MGRSFNIFNVLGLGDVDSSVGQLDVGDGVGDGSSFVVILISVPLHSSVGLQSGDFSIVQVSNDFDHVSSVSIIPVNIFFDFVVDHHGKEVERGTCSCPEFPAVLKVVPENLF